MEGKVGTSEFFMKSQSSKSQIDLNNMAKMMIIFEVIKLQEWWTNGCTQNFRVKISDVTSHLSLWNLC